MLLLDRTDERGLVFSVTKPDVADLDVSYGTSIRHSRGVRRRMRVFGRWRRSAAALRRPSIPHPELREVSTDDADAVGTLHGNHEASAELHATREDEAEKGPRAHRDGVLAHRDVEHLSDDADGVLPVCAEAKGVA